MSQEINCDVVVIGAGCAGVVAATAAARTGAKTVLVERHGFAGGTATVIHGFLSFLDGNGNPVIGGIPEEFMREVWKLGGSGGHFTHDILMSSTPTDVEIVKYVAQEMPRQAGVKFMLHTWFSGASIEDGVIDHIEVVNKSGRQRIRARAYIDCSGDGDLAAEAGAIVERGNESGGLQPLTMTFRMGAFDREDFIRYLEKHPEDLEINGWSDRGHTKIDYLKRGTNLSFFGGFEKLTERVFKETGYRLPRKRVHFYFLPREGYVQINVSRISGRDAANAEDLTEAELEGRKQVFEITNFLKTYVPGFKNAFVVDTPMQVGIRETRRIIGEYIITKRDVLEGTHFEDTVCKGIYPLDIHHPKGLESHLVHPKEPYQIPYRALTPKGLKNILVAGRCVSSTHEALGALRVIGNCMGMGQAAGTAAAMACEGNGSGLVKEISVPKLRSNLTQTGAIL